jgi:EAL domain-containing protein (putative c-di-GMP-specific phosphodiesterase class I)
VEDSSVDGFADGIARCLRTPSSIRCVLQPIVDLQRGSVVGYEALARFPGPPDASPDRWFAAADALGAGPALATVTLTCALEHLAALPPNTFLTVNLEPHHLLDAGVVDALCPPGVDRRRVVVELTEHAAVDIASLAPAFARVRSAGARIAIDDAGAGYAGLTVLLEVRPDLVKLDRSLVSGVDSDPARRVLVEAVGELTSSIDAWVLAEGIETLGEVEELVRLGVPLGQGYLLGRPVEGCSTDIPLEVAAAIQAQLRRGALDDSVVSLLERVAVVDASTPVGHRPQLVGDELGRPVAVDRGDGTRSSRLLLAKPSEPIDEVARRVAARPGTEWTSPIVVTDGRGVAIGVVTVPRLLRALAR